MTIVDILMKTELCESRSEAYRKIKEGAVRLDGRKVEEIGAEIEMWAKVECGKKVFEQTLMTTTRSSRMKRTVKATCVVRVVVDCQDSWSDDTTMAQILAQAETSAKGRIDRLFSQAVTADKDLSSRRSPGLNDVALGSIEKIVIHVTEERE